jgi:hypothetical protein
MGKYMSNIKRLSLALVALGLSAPAFADSTVLVPSQHGGFKIGVDALYLRPTNTHLDYATVVTTQANFAGGYDYNKSVTPSFDWGVYAQIGYLFPCTSNDLTLGYTYLRTNDSDELAAPAPSVNGTTATSNGAVSVMPLSFLANDGFASAEAKAKFTMNVADLETGQRFTTGSYDMRMFAGLRYAKIDVTRTVAAAPFALNGVTSGVNTDYSGDQELKSKFNGLGPRIGIDARYCFNSGFGLDANLSTALLAGRTKSNYAANVIENDDGTVTTTSFGTHGSDSTCLVPVVEARLGLDYTYINGCTKSSTLVFNAGYQATNYFNASGKPPIDNTSFVNGRETNDVSFDGPYLGVKYYA